MLCKMSKNAYSDNCGYMAIRAPCALHLTMGGYYLLFSLELQKLC